MKPQNDLLKEILAGDEVSSFREASLQTTLAAVRTQCRRRRALAACAVVALILASAMLIKDARLWPATGEIVSSDPVSAPPVAPAVKVISDEELFALFPGRSMALVGKPGQQQLVFLDGKEARSSVN
jgi:hypothetical protein